MLRARIFTAVVLGSAIAVTILFFPTWVVAVLLGALWLAGACEWTQFVADSGVPRWVYCAVFPLLMLSAGLYFDARGAELVATLGLCWWLLAGFALWAYPRRLPTSVVMIFGPAALLPAWFLLAYIHGSGPQGPLLTLSLIAIIWVADIGAYLVGGRFGRVKLAPNISPGKTWEGVFGGLVMSGAAAAVAATLIDISVVAFVSLALAATLVSIVGDLTVSMLKRYAGVKDSGRLLPGHGGVLDRIDSLAAGIPFFYIGLVFSGI